MVKKKKKTKESLYWKQTFNVIHILWVRYTFIPDRYISSQREFDVHNILIVNNILYSVKMHFKVYAYETYATHKSYLAQFVLGNILCPYNIILKSNCNQIITELKGKTFAKTFLNRYSCVLNLKFKSQNFYSCIVKNFK